MIGFMPDFYPDELVYSLLARYYQRSGYLAYRYAAKELFEDPSARQDMYFLPRLTSRARTVLTEGTPTEALIERHTMFPCFCRFLPVERRGKAFRAMMAMEGKYDSLVAMPNRKPGLERCLRYCPECAKEDREKYGETYWHRCAQIHDIGVCPRHGCLLVDSGAIISGRMPPMLTTAEEGVPENEAPVSCDSEIQMRLAGYMADAFAAPLALDNPTPVGDFLHSKMAWTKYRSVRGEQRNIALLAHDFKAYYRSLPVNDFYKDWQLQKVMNNDKPTFKYICMVAMFLNIRIEELADMSLPEKAQEQLFDEKVRKLHEEGMKYPTIAEHVGAPYDLVKAIGEGRYGTCHKPSRIQQKCGQRELDWEALDRETLPRVKAYIDQKQSAASGKPSKITLNSVEQALKLPSKRLQKMPLCRNLSYKNRNLSNSSGHGSLYGRLTSWILEKHFVGGESGGYLNIKRERLCACIPYLTMFTDEATAKNIQRLLGKK